MHQAATTKLPNTLFAFIWYFLKPYKTVVLIYALLALAAGFWGPFNAALLRHVVNILPNLPTADTTVLLLPVALIVINFIVLDNFTWRSIDYFNARYVPVILTRIDKALLNQITKQSYSFFQERMAGSIAKQVLHMIDGVEKIIATSASNLLRAVSLLLMCFIFAYHVNAVFLFILLIWSVLFFTFSIKMSKRLSDLAEHQANNESVLSGQLIDCITHVFNIILFSRRDDEIKRRDPALNDYIFSYRKKEMYAFWMRVVQGGLIAVMMAVSCYFLVHLHGQGLLTTGDFVLILGLAMEAGHMMWYTMYLMDEFNKAYGRAKQGLCALTVPYDIREAKNSAPLRCAHGNIHFQQVSFRYQDSKTLFQDLTLSITGGQKVGLVGYSGGGKSTFVNLILRLHDVSKGSILIDGQDISCVTQESLRENIAMIPQDPTLFHRSLMENIRYGRIDASDAEVIEAAKKAHAHEFISLLPQGYDSLVGERGVKLSGGQRQRIAIARAILKNAPILILDEATSQLDSVTESLIQESLCELMQGHYDALGRGKTTIVIAHRLSTLLHMDRILVFDKGKIVEDGTHAELLEKDGLYKHLWDAQVGGFLGDDHEENEV